MGSIVPRDQISIYDPVKKQNGSGGFTLDTSTKGTLVLSGLAQVDELRPTRDQLAEQARFSLTLKVQLWARVGIDLKADMVLYWNEKPYVLQGPPARNSNRTQWTLYAKSSSV